MYSLPLRNLSMWRFMKDAAVPTPSEQPELPLPATELTRPEASKDLTAKLPLSAMYMVREAGSTATPVGPLNSAAEPTSSTQPWASLPARVLVYQ